MNKLFSLSGNVALQQQTLLSAFTAAPLWLAKLKLLN